MPIKILMPALSPTMTEGNLTRWTKKEGDKVKPGEVIAEIETDKATMEVEAVDEGRIGKILVAGGSQGVKVNDVIAVLLEDGENEVPANFLGASASKPANTSTPAQPSVAAMPSAAPVAAAPIVHSGSRVIASPLAKRVAEQTNVDLRRVSGTGPNGRIIR
ncbi:MAG: E3 binding domain-containing protein, partial [Alphaproteobacteria bacterium]|nr:E3 binding domain-containing protein [Alphaproteobacteria bacterium]